VAACDKFIYTEILKPLQAQTVPDGQAPEPLELMIRTALAATARDNGWASLAAVGSMMAK